MTTLRTVAASLLLVAFTCAAGLAQESRAIAVGESVSGPRFLVNPTSDSTVVFERVERKDLTAEELSEYAGRYYSEEIETRYELRVEEGTLAVHTMRMDSFALSHRQGDEFSSSQFFLTSVSFQRAGNGRITGFEASNGRTKGVWFRRQ